MLLGDGRQTQPGESMKTLAELRRSKHTHFGFYLTDDEVLFEYSGPFDLNTGEWVSVSGKFSRADFARGIEMLEDKSECEMTGTRGERLQLRAQPTGKMALESWGGYGNNIMIPESGISASELRLDSTG
jgi:hypothetical protein